MNPQTLARAQEIAIDVLAKVQPDQLELPTPCDNWNVAQVIDHLVGAQYWAMAAIEGTEMSETGEGASAGDFKASFAQAGQALLGSLSVEGALERTVNPGFGDMPAPALVSMAVTDTFTHAWDIAKATGQSTDLDPEFAVQCLQGAKVGISDAFRSEEGSIFGLEQNAPAGASAADQLAAFLGRSV